MKISMTKCWDTTAIPDKMEKDSNIIMILVLIPIFPTISYADLPDDFCNDLRQKYSNEISDHIQCHDTGKISENKLYLLPFIM